jgi:hypothetical protein
MTHLLLTDGTPAAEALLNGNQRTPNIHASIVEADEPKAKANCERERKRGRPAISRPNQKHLEILRATRMQTYEQVGAAFGISRQRVGQIIRRWKQYSPVRLLRSQKNPLLEPAAGLRVKKENRVHIVSFRLTDAEFQLLQLRYPEMKSADRAARGIVTRFLSL